MGISFFRNLVDYYRLEPSDDVCGRTALAADAWALSIFADG
jgi:hypothetical protein